MTSNTDILYLLVFTLVTLASATDPKVYTKTVNGFPSLGLHKLGVYYPPKNRYEGFKKVKLSTAASKKIIKHFNTYVDQPDYDYESHVRNRDALVKCQNDTCIVGLELGPKSTITDYDTLKSNGDVRESADCHKNPSSCKKLVKKCACSKKNTNSCTKNEGPISDKCAEAMKKIEECKKKCKEKKDTKKDAEGTNSTDNMSTSTRNPDPFYPDWDPTKSYEVNGEYEPYVDRGVLKFRAKHMDRQKTKGLQRKFSLDYVGISDLTWRAAKNVSGAMDNTTYDPSTGNINSNYTLNSALDKTVRIRSLNSKNSDNAVHVHVKPSSILKKLINTRNATKKHSLQLIRTKNVTINYGEEPKVVRSMNVNLQSKNLASDTPDDIDAFIKDLRLADSENKESRNSTDNSDNATRNETADLDSTMPIAKIIENMSPEKLFSAILAHNQRRALKKWSQKTKKSKKSDESEEDAASESAEKKSDENILKTKSESKSSETEEDDDDNDDKNRLRKPKRFQVIDGLINKFVEKELFKFQEKTSDETTSDEKSSETTETDPLSAEEDTTTTEKPKKKKKFKKGTGAPMTIIQAPGRMYKEGEDFRRNRLPYFLPKRYDWDPKDYQRLGYFWFNGPQGRNPGPWRIYY